MYRNPDLRKAIAFSLFVKSKTKSSTVHRWSINKLHELTGCCAGVVAKRLDLLRSLGLVEETGKNNNCLVFKSLKSHTTHRNASIHEVLFAANDKVKKNAYAQEIKNIEKLLAVAIIEEIQKNKDYAHRMIQQSKNPKNLNDYKEARTACKRFGYGKNFNDNGISYKHIAKRLGTCVKTAFEAVKFAVENNFLAKIRRTEKRTFPNVSYVIEYIKNNYTYIKNNYIYKVYSNRYVLAGMV